MKLAVLDVDRRDSTCRSRKFLNLTRAKRLGNLANTGPGGMEGD